MSDDRPCKSTVCSGSPLVSCAFIRCCARVPVCLEPGRHECAACCRPVASFLEACSGCPHHLLQRVPVSLLVNTLDNLQHSGLSTHQVQIVLQCCEHDPSAAFPLLLSKTCSSTAESRSVMLACAVHIRELLGEPI